MSVLKMSRVAVVGGESQIGRFLVPMLRDGGIETYSIGRQERGPGSYRFDEPSGSFDPPILGADAIINCAPLPVINQVLKMADGLQVKRVIAFGSTGRFSKANSLSEIERKFAAQQEEAELRFKHGSETLGLCWTLFRPTMIYGAGTDLNVAFIGKFIRRFGFFPIPIGANGLRQPVHAEDLAAACVGALECEQTCGRAYNLGGGDRLAYDEMVRRIFTALGMRNRLLFVPLVAYKLLVQVARKSPKYGFINPDMLIRMFSDLIVDNQDACSDFGYAPRKFFPSAGEICGSVSNQN